MSTVLWRPLSRKSKKIIAVSYDRGTTVLYGIIIPNLNQLLIGLDQLCNCMQVHVFFRPAAGFRKIEIFHESRPTHGLSNPRTSEFSPSEDESMKCAEESEQRVIQIEVIILIYWGRRGAR